jgi:hypothetical protein
VRHLKVKKFIKSALLLVLTTAIFLGVITATAGVSLKPELANISAWLLAGKGMYTIERKDFSYEPGHSGYFLAFYKNRDKNPENEVPVFILMIVNSLLYSSLYLLILLLFSPLYFKKFSLWWEQVLRSNNRL